MFNKTQKNGRVLPMRDSKKEGSKGLRLISHGQRPKDVTPLGGVEE